MNESTHAPIRWRRWISLAIGLMVVGVFIFHAIWGVVASHRFHSRIATLQKAGEPIFPADFVVTGSPANENGAIDIDAAAKLVSIDDELNKSFGQLELSLPLRPDESQIIESMQSRWMPAFAQLDIAQRKPNLEWSLQFKSPVLDMLRMRSLGDHRTLALALGAQALREHGQGQDKLMLKRLEIMLFLGRYVDKYPSLVGHIMAIIFAGMAADRIDMIAPDLRVQTGDARAADPAEIHHLIDLLLDEQSTRIGLSHAFQAERMADIDALLTIANGNVSGDNDSHFLPRYPASIRYLLKPMFYRNGTIIIDRMTRMIAMADEDEWPSAKAKITPKVDRSLLNAFADNLSPNRGSIVASHFHGLTERRIAAIVLAIRLYSAEHDGRLPQQLQELAPRYLPAVPLDPMSSGKFIGYVPRADSPILYSVGDDGVDDGGNTDAIRPRTRDISPWLRRDFVVHLTRQPRPLPEPLETAQDAIDLSTALKQVDIPATTRGE